MDFLRWYSCKARPCLADGFPQNHTRPLPCAARHWCVSGSDSEIVTPAPCNPSAPRPYWLRSKAQSLVAGLRLTVCRSGGLGPAYEAGARFSADLGPAYEPLTVSGSETLASPWAVPLVALFRGRRRW